MEAPTPPFNPTFINIEYFFNKILEVLTNFWTFGTSDALINSIKVGISIIAILLITLIMYCIVRLYELREARIHMLQKGVVLSPSDMPKNDRWQTVLRYMESASPSDWKLAIIEADLILDEMVEKMRYPGENLGERLKAVEKSDFTSLNEAWEAHKVRNKIAHEGADFSVSRTEARRVIGMYETVFREFDYI